MLLNRFWVIISVGFVSGAVLAKAQWITGLTLPVLFTFALLIFFIGKRKRIKYLDNVWIVLLFLSIGSLSYLLHPYPEEGDDFFLYLQQQCPNVYVEVEGYVSKNTLLDPSDRQIRFAIHITKMREGNTWKPIEGKALVLCRDAQFPLFTSIQVHLTGKTSLYLSPVNESLNSYENYLRSQRIYSKIFTSGPQIKIIHTPTFSPLFQISRIQQYFYNKFIKYMPRSIRDTARAIWLGDRSGLDYDEKRNFILTGTVHVLAISGLHIGLVFWFIRVIARALLKSRGGLPEMLALLICVFYTLVSGAHGSSLRAVLMLLIYQLYLFSRRNEDLLSALSITATLLFVFNTDLIWDPGTQMSILVVASILIFHKPITEFFHLLQFLPWTVCYYLSLFISSQILLLPLLIISNQYINLLSPIYNLFVVPLIALYLMASICGFVFIFIPGLPSLFFYSSGLFLILIRWLCDLGSSFSYTIFPVSRPSSFALVLYLFVCIFLYRWLRIRTRETLFVFVVGCIFLFFFWTGIPFDKKTTVHILDVGHGDAIVITTAENENILIDAGTNSMGKWVVLPFLHAKGIRKLDYVIATHADEDHIGGISSVIDKLKVHCFIHGEGFLSEKLGSEIINKAIAKGIPIMKVEEGQQIKLTKGFLDIIYAGRTCYEETNANSIVMRFIHNHFSILLTGDFPSELTNKELIFKDCFAKIIKIPHHGLKNSLNQDLLEKTRPQVAVVSVNEFRQNRGVRREIKELLQKRGIPVWRTDYYGGITIRDNGEIIEIYGARQKNGYLLRAN